jgi:hypothetical protein
VVVWGSLSLFAVLFALLTFQLSASPARVASKHDAATARKPAGSEFAETSGTEAEAGSGGAEPAPSEGELETESEEFEAAEAEAAEREAAELELIEAEESAPVVTGAS